MTSSGQTVCLNMIVKNEAHVLRRCLASVLPWIDTWAIVDTGSTDGTQELVRDFFAEMPGILAERPWVHFAHNRTEALELARGRATYVLLMDADEVLEWDAAPASHGLDADRYDAEVISANLHYHKATLVRDALPWRYVGVVHEYITCERECSTVQPPWLRVIRRQQGARSRDPLTYRRDALLLEGAVLDEPANPRHMFYLAQSYADAGEPALAIDRYRRRVAMGGWAEEVWFALYRIAQLQEKAGEPWAMVLESYLAAVGCRADRAEPLFRIGLHYQAAQQHAVAMVFLAQAVTVSYPANDILFVERDIYDFLLPLEFAVACFYLGRHADAIDVCNRLLLLPSLSAERVEQLTRNRAFSLEALYPARHGSAAPQSTSHVLVIVPVDRSSSTQVDRCAASLRSQPGAFQAVFLDRRQNLPDEAEPDSRLQWKRATPDATWADCVRLAAQAVDPGTILLVLSAEDWLAGPEAVQAVVDHFVRYDCAIMPGQFRWSDGRQGDNLPLASEAALHRPDVVERPLLPLAFRKSLLDSADADCTPASLLRTAGFSRIRFNDMPIVVREIRR